MTEFLESAAVIALVVLIGTSVVLRLLASEGRMMREYWGRFCMGRQWRRRFHAAPKDEIRRFLDLFSEVFGFDSSKRLKFAPGDKIMDIYRVLYPRAPRGSDNLEFETFVMSVENWCGRELVPTWRDDLTLGDIFAESFNGRGGAKGA